MASLFGLSQIVAQIPPRASVGLVWETNIEEGGLYYEEVEALLKAYELAVGNSLQPGPEGKVGLKVNTRGGRGLSTPHGLVRGLIGAMERRGFERKNILIVDHSAYSMRRAGFLPPLSKGETLFAGCPVLALDTKAYYNKDWYYDSPLPPPLKESPQFLSKKCDEVALKEGDEERKSFFAAPLLFEVDFWFNLVVGVDDPALGIDGALANVTLWNVSNSRRFLVNQTTASAAVAEIAAIPELQERLILHFMSMERYQFIAGPFFNSLYTRSEPQLRMSSDPVALDRLLFDRINELRLFEGFPEIDPLPRQLPFAASLQLGVFDLKQIHIRKVKTLRRIKASPVQKILRTE